MEIGTYNANINGINLENYIPLQNSFNSVVYVQKKFFKNSKNETNIEDNTKNIQTEGLAVYDDYKERNLHKSVNRDINSTKKNDAVVDKTIKFAKNIFPLVMPREDRNMSVPVVYTVKTSVKRKKKSHKTHHESSFDNSYNDTYKDKPKPNVNAFQNRNKNKKHIYHTQTSGSNVSQSNTMEDLNINQSSSSLFEIHNKKCFSCNRNNSEKYTTQKIAASESFEALANSGLDASSVKKIKIQLMNDGDKNAFRKSICSPVVQTIKECVTELHNQRATDTEMQEVQKYIKYNSQKLDKVLVKLSCIEERLDRFNIANEAAKSLKARVKVNKTVRSALEDLEEDVSETNNGPVIKSFATEEQYLDTQRENVNSGRYDNIIVLDNDFTAASLGQGEEVSSFKTSKAVDKIKADRPHRLPTRLCWTDASRRDEC